MKYLNCLMSHYEKNLSHVQNALSSCDPSAKLKFKTGLQLEIHEVCMDINVTTVTRTVLMLNLFLLHCLILNNVHSDSACI